MDKYEVVYEYINDLTIFGITLLKGKKYYNIRDNETGFEKAFSYYSSLDKDLVTKQCWLLNKYTKAKKFKIVKDGNDIHWVFTKSIGENTNFKSDDVWYVRQKMDGLYKELSDLNTGYKNLNQSKILLQKVRDIYEEFENSKIFKDVEE